jgi:MFS superfamily sulfate permease-like transporter
MCVVVFGSTFLPHTKGVSLWYVNALQVMIWMLIEHLSAIVISAGISLIDIEELLFLWKIRAVTDIFQMLGIFLLTLFFGPEVGAMCLIVASLCQV